VHENGAYFIYINMRGCSRDLEKMAIRKEKEELKKSAEKLKEML
jgi:hypothetical protein